MRMELFAIYLAWIAWFLTWIAAALWKRRATRTAPDQLTYRLIQLVGVALLFWTPPWLTRLWYLPAAGMWACFALTVLGFAICWWARIHLGLYWSSNVGRKADHKIINTGPYAFVRHPIYTGIILAGFATAGAKGTLLGLAGAGVMTVSWYVKARLEERFLRQELGPTDYDAYAARTPMLMPFFKF